MAYEKQTWTTGEVITQEKLNHMEDGIANAGGGGGDGLKNLVDGSATGSVRGVGTIEEDSSYTMGQHAFAEGFRTEASGRFSHAEGASTKASESYSHTEGYFTEANNEASHAEGYSSKANGSYSHTEGYFAETSGDASHAEGYGTKATHRAQHVVGMYNEIDPSQADSSMSGEYVEMVGNGSNDSNRSNARTLDWSGNETLQGSLTLGKGSADETTVTATQLKALIALLNQ